jgi:ribosomal protein S18 acetylase RimI-like enzyme
VVTVDKRQEETVHAYARSWREIDEIAVRPEDRRRGVASALFRHIEAATRADGISAVELNTPGRSTTPLAVRLNI